MQYHQAHAPFQKLCNKKQKTKKQKCQKSEHAKWIISSL